jgi:hypothetical protein
LSLNVATGYVGCGSLSTFEKQGLSNPVPPGLVSEGRKPVLVGKVRERFEQIIY